VAATTTFAPETQISPGIAAAHADIAFNHGACPTGVVVWGGQDPNAANGVYTVAYH
jgi:hypothetical protein